MRTHLQRQHGRRELRHRVHVLREALDEVDDVRREGGALVELRSDARCLRGRGDLARQEQPEEALGERLAALNGRGQELLQLGDGVAAEADPLRFQWVAGRGWRAEGAAWDEDTRTS